MKRLLGLLLVAGVKGQRLSGYFSILHFGNAFFSSAMPALVIWVFLRESSRRLVNPLRCTSPASVIGVSLR